MDPFHWFKNETLRQALQCRMNADIDEGQRLLFKAAIEDKDGYACYFLADAYCDGGWGLKASQVDMKKWALLAVEYGCKYGYIHLAREIELPDHDDNRCCDLAIATDDPVILCALDEINDNEDELKNLLSEGNLIAGLTLAAGGISAINKQMAILGDATCQSRYARQKRTNGNLKEGFEWATKSAKQMNCRGIGNLQIYYTNGTGCEVDMVKAAELFLIYNSPYSSPAKQRIKQITRMKSPSRDHLREMYVYGRAVHLGGTIKMVDNDFCKAIGVYNNTIKKTQKAIFTFMIAMKKLGSRHLNNDILIKIARMVWSSRDDPIVWNVTITK